MASDNQHTITRYVSILFATYGKNEPTTMAVYANLFKDIAPELLAKAIKKVCLEERFFPTPAVVVAAAKNLVEEASGNRVKNWDEAWHEIERAMQSTPWGTEPKFSTPEIQRAVKSFGWYDLQNVSAQGLNTARAQLREIYKTVCQRAQEKNTNEYVLGIGKYAQLPDGSRNKRAYLEAAMPSLSREKPL